MFKVCILLRVYNYYVQIFAVNATTVLFYSLHQALHVSTTVGHPQVLQVFFVYNYQTVTFTFTFVYM
jgi:hypothetical protein